MEAKLERVTPGCNRGKPEAGENSRGELRWRDLTSYVGQQHLLGEQSLEVDSHRDGAGNTAGSMEERHEGNGQRNLERLQVREKPLKRETLNAAAG